MRRQTLPTCMWIMFVPTRNRSHERDRETALELRNSGLKVLVLESGGTERTADADQLNEVENGGRPRVTDQWLVRNRLLGGTSNTWAGRCTGFDEIDYESRSWV